MTNNDLEGRTSQVLEDQRGETQLDIQQDYVDHRNENAPTEAKVK